MEGRGDRQNHRALGAFGLGDLDRALDRGLVARHHHLAAAIVVGGLAHLALRRFGGDRRSGVEFEPDQRRHGADADRHRFLHRLPARAQQPRGVGNGEGAGRGERGIFAERMAGDELRVALEIEPGFGFQHAHDRERDRHQRRLGVFGERERLGRAFEYDAAELGAERPVDLVEHGLRGREIVGQRLAHADRLAALAGKHKSCRHAPITFAVCGEFGPKDTAKPRPVKLRPAPVTKRKGLYRLGFGAMSQLVTDEDLARARRDPVFRQQLLAENLDRLLEALKYLRMREPEALNWRARSAKASIWRSSSPTGCSRTPASPARTRPSAVILAFSGLIRL